MTSFIIKMPGELKGADLHDFMKKEKEKLFRDAKLVNMPHWEFIEKLSKFNKYRGSEHPGLKQWLLERNCQQPMYLWLKDMNLKFDLDLVLYEPKEDTAAAIRNLLNNPILAAAIASIKARPVPPVPPNPITTALQTPMTGKVWDSNDTEVRKRELEGLQYSFFNKADAMLFKLRWSEDIVG